MPPIFTIAPTIWNPVMDSLRAMLNATAAAISTTANTGTNHPTPCTPNGSNR